MIPKIISKIKLINFQAHQETTINLGNGLNVIAGTSDSGKSSVIRSLLWVLRNRPSGGSVRNWDCEKDDPVLVRIEQPIEAPDVSEIAVGKRRKGDTSTYFFDVGFDVVEYEAVGKDVPEEIVNALNLSDINIQTQHDPYFLLNDSSGEVARKLNEYVGLDVIDRIFKYLNSSVTAIKDAIKTEEKKGKELQAGIDNLQWVPPVKEKTTQLKKGITALRQLKVQWETVASIARDLSGIEVRIAEASNILSIQPEMLILFSRIDLYRKNADQFNRVFDMINELRRIDQEVEKESGWDLIEKLYSSLNQTVIATKTGIDQWGKVDSLVAYAKSIDEGISQISDTVETEKKEYDRLLRENGVCPLCGAITGGEK